VAVLLTALLLVQKIGKNSFLARHQVTGALVGAAQTARNSDAAKQTPPPPLHQPRCDVEIGVFDVARVQKTCTFVWGLLGKRECTAACAVGIALYLRSLCDVKMVHLITAVESAIVNRNPSGFQDALKAFLIFMVPVSSLNALLNYSVNELALCLRETLSKRLLATYTQGNTFYRINQQVGSGTAAAADAGVGMAAPAPAPAPALSHAWDQVLTHDVEEFTYALAGLFSHVLKPTVDVIHFSHQLYTGFSGMAPAGLGAYMVGSGLVLNWLRAPHGQFSSGEQAVEGEYRASVARINTHAEQVASLGGGQFELRALRTRLAALVSYVRNFAQFRACMGTIDGVAAKYFLSYLGWLLIADPFLINPAEAATVGGAGVEQRMAANSVSRYEHYHIVARLMVNLSSAVGSLVLSGRDVVRCLGMGWRLASFAETLEFTSSLEAAEQAMSADGNSALPLETAQSCSDSGSGIVDTNGYSSNNFMIDLTDVIVASPNPRDAPLLRSLSMQLIQGRSTIITGPNGSGKSSLLRVLAGMWRPREGTIAYRNGSREDNVFYLPQNPYMPLGSLRDQIIYPCICMAEDDSEDSVREHETGEVEAGADRAMISANSVSVSVNDRERDKERAKPSRDELLCSLLQAVQLGYLIDGPDAGAALDTHRNWEVVLSGGEKQRLSMARLYYHHPKFAFLDECTSAVSAEVEELLYAQCKKRNITLVTVSHKPGIRSFHDVELRLFGDGTHAITAVKT